MFDTPEETENFIRILSTGTPNELFQLKALYRARIRSIAKKNLCKGGLDKQLSFASDALLVDIESAVWADLWVRFCARPKKPKLTNVFGFIYRLTTFRTIDMVRKTIAHRKLDGDVRNRRFLSMTDDAVFLQAAKKSTIYKTPDEIHEAESNYSFAQALLSELPVKERRVMEEVLRGRSQVDISKDLKVSIKTIYNYTARFKERVQKAQ